MEAVARNFCAFLCSGVFVMALLMASASSGVDANLRTDMIYIRMCNRTAPISLRTMNEVLITKKLGNIGAESRPFKCFLHCLFTKFGWMDDEGGFMLHHIKRTLQEAEIEIDSLEFILFKCTALEIDNKCERAYAFTQCFWEKMEEQQSAVDEQLFYNVDEKK